LPVTFMFPMGAVKLPEMMMLLNVSVLLPLIVVVPSNVTVPPFALKVPELIQLPATFIFATGAVSMLDAAMSILLKELIPLGLIVVVPSKVTVPPFPLNVPALTQLPLTFMFAAGAVRLLDAAISRLSKEFVLAPLIVVVPLNVTVPPLAVKVPALTQSPAIFIFAAGAVNVLKAAISRLLNEFVLAPVTAVVPSNVTVPLFALKVPALTQLPETFMFALGAVKILEAAMSRLLKEFVLAPVIAVIPSNVTIPPFALKAPALSQPPLTFMFAAGAVSVLDEAMLILLKESVLTPVIAVVPLKVTVPPLALKVPALTQLPATFMFAAGAVRLLDAAISRLLKESVLAPLIAVVPSKVTVPPLAVKVPALTQLPATFIFAAGAVSVLDAAISRLLKEFVLAPLIAVVPSKVTVPPLALKAPALTQLPATFIFAAGAVSVLEAAISKLLKEFVLAPVIAVAPSKVTVPPLAVKVPALTQLPETFMFPAGAVSVLNAAISRLLKELVLAPVIAVVPSKVTVPALLLNVPALTQLPETFMFAFGAVNVLDAAMLILLKELVLAPVIAVVPSKVTVPPLAVKVPALTQLPATFIFAFGAVSVLEAAISRLLKELTLAPVIAVEPSNVTVPPFALKAPALTQLPPTFIFTFNGPVSVLEAAISRLLKELILAPLIAVEPSKVTVPPLAVKVPALTQLPATFMSPLDAVKVFDAVMFMLLKEVLLLPVIAVEPSKVTVPPFALKAPALTQLPPTFIFAFSGPVNVLEAAISRLLKEFILAPVIAVEPSKVTVPPLAVKVPALTQLPATFMSPIGAVKVFDAVMSMLLKEVLLLPVIAVVPSKVTVPPLALKAPALTQLPATFMFAAGAVNVLDAAISRLLKEFVLAPLIVVVPSKVTVPPLAVKVPALTQLPPTFMFTFSGPVNVLDAVMPILLKESVLAPVIAVVPSKVTVPPLAVKVPALTQLPATFMFAFGAVSVLEAAISRLLNEFVLAPLIVVAPLKVTVPPFGLKVPALTQLPLTFMFTFSGPVNVLEAAISRLLNEFILAPVIAVVPSNVTVPPLAVKVPALTQLPATFMFATGAVKLLDAAMSRLAKEFVLPPVIAVVPSKVTVPPFALKVPALPQLPATFMFAAGAVRLLDAAIPRLSKELLLLPLITVVPSNVTVPELLVKAPELTQLPATFMFAAGAVRLLDEAISKLLKELVLAPLIAVEPSKVTVPLFALKVPALIQLPPTFMFAFSGAVNVLEAAISRLLKELVLPPLIAVVPLKFTVPPLAVKVPALAQLPETFNVLVGAVNVPDEMLTLVVLTVPPAPVNVPPLMVKPPLKF